MLSEDTEKNNSEPSIAERTLRLKEIEIWFKMQAAERRFDIITLMVGLTVFAFYVLPPANNLLRNSYSAAAKVAEVSVATTNVVQKVVEQFAPDLQGPARVPDVIAGFPVTSNFGPREAPVPGASTFHRGVDLGTPIGTRLYAIGEGTGNVEVECFEDTGGGGTVARYSSTIGGTEYIFQYLHLSKCQSGSHPVTSVIALSGNTGLGSGAHFHLEHIIPATNEKVEPMKWMVYASLTGRLPANVNTGDNK